MIDISELRLNNIIQNQHGEFCKVWSLNVEIAGRQKDDRGLKIIGVRLLNDSGKGPVMSNAKGDKFKGVDLTEEIIIRCGACTSVSAIGSIFSFEYIPSLEIFYDTHDSIWSVTYGDTLLCEINELHQLQNLIFDLSKHELPFQL